MKIIELQQNTLEWLQWRETGIGASDIATILGLSPYKTRYVLWAEKTGKQATPDLSHNPNVERGIRLEPYVRSRIEEVWNESLDVFCAEHDEHPQLKVSFDGVDSFGCPHEIKCPSDATFAEVELFGEESDAFNLYKYQVKYQCMVAGRSKGYLHFYSETTDALLTFPIELTEADVKELIDASLSFWNLILNDQAPELDKKRDHIDASYIHDQSLIQLLLDSKVTLTNAEAQIKEMRADHAELENKFIASLGEFDRFEDKDFGLKVTKFESKGRVNYSQFIKDNQLESEVDKYRGKPSNGVKFTYKEVKK